MRRNGWLVLLPALVSLPVSLSAADNPRLETTVFSTPPGITLVEVSRRPSSSQPMEVLWIRLSGADGETLFVSDNDSQPNVSRCSGDCAREFPPLIALPGSRSQGDWTLVERSEGKPQWAYKGKPLYRFARETRLNEVVDNLLTLQKRGEIAPDYIERKTAEDLLLPPSGWRVARFDPAADTAMPGVVHVKDLPAVSGLVFVDSAGMTLYSFVGKETEITAGTGDEPAWRPLEASELANSMGPFTPVRTTHGGRQWTYRGKLLFTYGGDLVPGNVNGLKQVDDQRWNVAMLARHFMPREVMVRHDRVFGEILANAQGFPLYSRYAIERLVYLKRTEDDVPYDVGKAFGTKGCDNTCLQTWRPLLASADAQSQGYWEPVARADGSRQWAYKGFVQFTNVNDQPFARVTANNQYVYVVGTGGRYDVGDTLPAKNEFSVTAGFHWRVSDLSPR